MEITQHLGPESLELRLTGRIDAVGLKSSAASSRTRCRRLASRRAQLRRCQIHQLARHPRRLSPIQTLKSVNGSLLISHPTSYAAHPEHRWPRGNSVTDDGQAAAAAAPGHAQRQRRGAATYESIPAGLAPLSCTLIANPFACFHGYTESDCRSSHSPARLRLGLAHSEKASPIAKPALASSSRRRMRHRPATSELNTLPDYVAEEGELVPKSKPSTASWAQAISLPWCALTLWPTVTEKSRSPSSSTRSLSSPRQRHRLCGAR